MTKSIPTLVLALAALFAGAAAFDDEPSNEPAWIWRAPEAKANEVSLFRRRFELPDAAIRAAVLTAAADNLASIELNGELILESDDWSKPVAADDLEKFLAPGWNELSVRAANEAGPAGFIARLRVEFEDGEVVNLVTDQSWQARQEGDDAAAWTGAIELATLSEGGVWSSVTPVRFDNAEAATPPGQATPADRITAPPGFEVERLYSVPKSQGSWVSLTFDERGRIWTSDQYGRLYRVSLDAQDGVTVDAIDLPIGGAQGLLHAFDRFYIVASGDSGHTPGLYVATDTDGDDDFDEFEQLIELNHGGEHGPHAIVPGPDGESLYLIAGNHTDLPEGTDRFRTTSRWGEDLLLPREWDPNGHAVGIEAPGGWLLRLDPDGGSRELISIGMRNAYDLAFNADGEAFTFDSDMEWDHGLPWYRPTRILHLTSGSEFGWRSGSGKWPASYPDNLPAVVDIGLTSPTGVAFGYGARFPERYQRALYTLDWAYGVIYAVHLEPHGSSYRGSFEEFITGRPLPVTDVAIGPDGAMYFTIGGRRTQSGLYRVSYSGSEESAPFAPSALRDERGAPDRRRRHEFETSHGVRNDSRLKIAIDGLNDSDRFMRYAARLALESQPLEVWRDRALSDSRAQVVIESSIALARAGAEESRSEIVERLNAIDLQTLSVEQLLGALRAYGLTITRLGPLSDEERSSVIAHLDPHFPTLDESVNRELARLLVALEAPGVVSRCLDRMASSPSQEDAIHYAFILRNGHGDPIDDEWRRLLDWLNTDARIMRGGASFERYLEVIRADAVEVMDEATRGRLADAINAPPVFVDSTMEGVRDRTPRRFVRHWQMSDFAGRLDEVWSDERSLERGRTIYVTAGCLQCHRIEGAGGANGPDLTGAGGRFTPRDLLEAIVDPSRVISSQYADTEVLLTNGDRITGHIEQELDDAIILRAHPLAEETTRIDRLRIESTGLSSISSMPEGSIDIFEAEEILDLLRFVLAADRDAVDSP
ncbi:MAG: c-type cytochrome [Phycisphaerales bacterium]